MAKKRIKRDYTHLVTKIESEYQKKSNRDERFWQLQRDKESNGFAVIRFLPDKDPNALPYRTVFKHVVKIQEKYFIEKCPTSIEKDCPICEWNKSQPSDFVMEHKTYRKKNFYSNILVVKDPANPENEGKIFLFEFGPQLHKILHEKLFPSFAGEDKLVFFDPDVGANFKIKVKKDGQYASWASSEFAVPTVIDKDLEKLKLDWEAVETNLFDLKEVINETSYKKPEDIERKFIKFCSSVGLESGLALSVETSQNLKEAKDYAETKSEAMEEVYEKKEDKSDSDSEDDGKSEDDEKFAEYFKETES